MCQTNFMSSSEPEIETANRYCYQRFPDNGVANIRIATLQPGEVGDVVHINLSQQLFSTEKKPFYHALSYVWGEPETRAARVFVKSEQCNVSSQGWLPVRSNLMSALRHLRYSDRARNLWVDAICVNQNDDSEKGPQVAMMGTIYADAAAVIVWLGPAADESDRALAVMQQLGSQYDADWLDFTLTPRDIDQSDTETEYHAIFLDNMFDDLLSIYRLFCRDWFDRLWIRQEVFLAAQHCATITCGYCSIPWALFRCAWLVIRRGRFQEELPEAFEHIEEWASRMQTLDGFMSQYPNAYLDRLWQDFGGSRCADPRDRIYAVRGLLYADIADAIEPDYTRSVVEVYRGAMLIHSNAFNSLDILGQCQYAPTWEGPSWVPDWSSEEQRGQSLALRMASGMLRAPWEMKEGTLRVSGAAVATVDDLTPLFSDSTSPGHELITLRALHGLLQQESRDLDDTYPDGSEIHSLDECHTVGGQSCSRYGCTVGSAYARTLCKEFFWENDFTPLRHQTITYSAAERAIYYFKNGSFDTLQEYVSEQFLSEAHNACRGRLFMRTTNGHVGLAPRIAKPGDKVCLVLGCGRLLLLRPVHRNRHVVIGECYLCGHSLGEAVLGQLPPSFRTIWAYTDTGGYQEVFEDIATGERTRNDPRLGQLNIDLTTYQERLKTSARPYLDVDVEKLNEQLSARGQGVRIQNIELV